MNINNFNVKVVSEKTKVGIGNDVCQATLDIRKLGNTVVQIVYI